MEKQPVFVPEDAELLQKQRQLINWGIYLGIGMPILQPIVRMMECLKGYAREAVAK